jgi:hypothetical protein
MSFADLPEHLVFHEILPKADLSIDARRSLGLRPRRIDVPSSTREALDRYTASRRETPLLRGFILSRVEPTSDSTYDNIVFFIFFIVGQKGLIVYRCVKWAVVIDGGV